MPLKAKAILGVAGLTIIAGVGLFASGVLNPAFTDAGVDVRNTACEDIPAARLAIATELEGRRKAARDALLAARDAASDAYWAKNQVLEREYHECISRALTADPCKEPFERIGKLYEEIMADFAADKGFNEAKFNEREKAKEEYNKCVEDTHKPEFYKDKETQCDAQLAAGREANQQVRTAADAVAQVRHDEVVARAEAAYEQKQAILNAIAEKCNEPGKTSNVMIGALTTEGTGAVIQLTSSACTGVFPGNDPEIERQISQLESQLQKAKAGGERKGLLGTEHIQETLDRLRQELADSPRTCKKDADCGNAEPVCCSGTTVGRAYCNAGVCAREETECVSPEICAGKPAACVAPWTGATQQEGVYITRTIPEKGSCSQNLQVLNLEQATPESARYAIVGNIPNWLHIDKPGGTLPGKATVTYSCNTVQGFGPGTYTVGASITVTNAAGELINTIPFNVAITVTRSEKTVDVIEYRGALISIDQVHKFAGPECDEDEHWHANSGSAIALDGKSVPDTSDCGYGKTKDVPVRTVPDTRNTQGTNNSKGTIEVRGLEGLKAQ